MDTKPRPNRDTDDADRRAQRSPERRAIDDTVRRLDDALAARNAAAAAVRDAQAAVARADAEAQRINAEANALIRAWHDTHNA